MLKGGIIINKHVAYDQLSIKKLRELKNLNIVKEIK